MLKQFSLGPVGNSVLGLAAAAARGMDLGSIVSNVAGAGIGVGLIKSKMAQS